MDIFDEKQELYEQMRLLIEERRELTKAYYDLKKKLDHFGEIVSSNQLIEQEVKNKNWSIDMEHQKYLVSKKMNKSTTIIYQDIALKIASFLKESGIPVQTKEIFDFLMSKYNYSLSYSNFSSNIMPRIHADSTINVEKAYRGYWQYRVK